MLKWRGRERSVLPCNLMQLEPSLRKPEQVNRLSQVTSLSKYLAMLLFVLLPFLGGYIGYVYAPLKVVEVEQVVYRPVLTERVETGVTSGQISASATIEKLLCQGLIQIKERVCIPLLETNLSQSILNRILQGW